jgi:hypothetical protein
MIKKSYWNFEKKKTNQEKDKNIEIKIIGTKNELRKQMQ